MAAQLAQVETTIFQVCVQIKNVQDKKYTQQTTGYAAEIGSFNFELVYTIEFLSRNTLYECC